MISISICMIVKNEEDVLYRCLESIKNIADEIIIVDTGSEDSTKEIAKIYTDKIYDYKWNDNFSDARNYAFSKSSMDYQMWMDADDILLEKDQKIIKEIKENLSPDTSIVMMKYDVAFDENGNTTMSYYRERLISRKENFKWVGAVHEVIVPSGKIIYSQAAVTHKKLHPSDSNRNLNIYEKILKQGETLEPRHQFYYARELYYHAKYKEAIDVFSKFLDEGNGWLENNISACLNLYECYRNINEQEKSLLSLFRSFTYDTPRAEICCQIGFYFMERNLLKQAIYWYTQASEQDFNESNGGFVSIDCYNFIPFMQLCVCYDRLGKKDLAKKYHKKAQKIKPEDPSVLYNEKYFNSQN